jgi:hypothetical protein
LPPLWETRTQKFGIVPPQRIRCPRPARIEWNKVCNGGPARVKTSGQNLRVKAETPQGDRVMTENVVLEVFTDYV